MNVGIRINFDKENANSIMPNSTWRGIILLFPVRDIRLLLLVSDIPAGDGKIANLFYSAKGVGLLVWEWFYECVTNGASVLWYTTQLNGTYKDPVLPTQKNIFFVPSGYGTPWSVFPTGMRSMLLIRLLVLYTVNRLAIFPSLAGMLLTKLFLAGKN